MTLFRRLVVGLLAIWCATGAASRGEAPSRLGGDPAGVAGVLLLTNDNVVAGRIVRTGDEYRVSQEHAELRISADRVALFCRSLEEAYELRRVRLGRLGSDATAADFLHLAHWCLRHDLLTQAGEMLRAARQIDPRRPGLEAFERQLQQRRLAQTQPERAAEAQPPVGRPLLAVDRSRLESETGRSARSTLSDGASETGRSARPTAPDEAQAEFVRRIQPMLIESCATTGCHAPDSTRRLKLDRLAVSGSGHPALIRENLAAALGQVDRANPEASPLVDLGGRAHGPAGGRSAPLSPRQMELLVRWAYQVADLPPPVEPPDEANDAELEPADEEVENTHDAPWTSRDRFDPELFNRRRPKSRGARTT